jgi:hypothetical protein
MPEVICHNLEKITGRKQWVRQFLEFMQGWEWFRFPPARGETL